MKTRKERSRPEPGLRRTLARALLAALAGVPCVVHAQAWSLNANGNWNVPGNWTPAAFPDATGAAAVLGNAITASRTITLGQNITVGSLAIDNANAYIVTGSTLSFAPASGSGTLAVTAVNGNGAHTVSSAIGLGSGLVVSNASTGTLTLSGVISGAGGLTKAGTGRLALGAVNTYGGPTVIENGALDYNVGTAIPGTSAVTVGDGAGAAASAQLVFNTTVPSAAALNVTVASDGVVVQGNNRLVRLASIAGSGEMRINSTVGQLFELNGTGGDTTYAGLVTGGIATASFDPNAGSRLAKSGASTIAFAGANTFVARLFITGGAIRAANASALGAASAGTSNATFVSGAGALELDGGITVAERVYLNGAGPGGSGALRSVTGSNVLTGGVTLGWTGGAVAPAAVSIGAAAGSTLTLSGVVDGTQSLTKVGDGTVVLNAVNTWSGGTTVNAGVLRLGVAAGLPNAAPLAVNGGTLDLAGASRSVTSLSGTGGSIALGAGTLTVNQATDTTYAGSIAGSGALVKAGAGVLALTGTTTHTGGTAVNAGTLQGTAASLQGTIANAATVVFDQAADGTFNGALSGAGTVRKRGAGTLVVAGPQSYAGPTTVEAGTLQVNGALASAVNVLGGAAIAGTGTVGALTVSSGATVAPGSAAAPYGTLVVNGAYAHAAGAALRVNVDAAGQASRLQVNGPATLAGGQVDARAAPGNYARSTSYTLLDASGGVTGAFGGVTIDAAFLSPVLVYEPGRVRLTLTRNSLPFADAALTPNQRAVATALDGAAAAGATGDMATVLSAVSNLSAPAARAAYESMGGLMYALLPSFGVTDASQFLSLSAQRLSSRRNVAATRSADLGAAASAPLQNDALAALAGTLLPLADQAHRSVWVVASGLGGSMDGDASGGDYDNRAGSIAFGADTALSDRWTLGAAGGYSRWRITNDGRGDRADVDVYRVAAYARYADGPLRLDGAVALARLDYDTARRIAFGTIDRQASADYDSTQASARLEGGYAMPWRRYVFEPYANFTYVRERVDAFQETGAGSVSLAVSERTANSTRAGAGLRVAREFDLGGAPAAAQVLAGYARELSGVPSFDALMIGDPSRTAMTITAETYDRNSAILGAMLAVAPRRNLVIRLDAGAELRGDYDSFTLAASARYLW
jgi:autotransporter-associated beta strand protein